MITIFSTMVQVVVKFGKSIEISLEHESNNL